MPGFIVAVDKPIFTVGITVKTNTGGVQSSDDDVDKNVDIPSNEILNSRVTNALAAQKPVLSVDDCFLLLSYHLIGY